MTEEKAIKYPKWMDEYFQKNQVIIKTLPDEYRLINKQSRPNKGIKNTLQFVTYLTNELNFWNYQNINHNPIVSQYPTTIKECLKHIDDIKDLPEKIQTTNYFSSEINKFIQTCKISSSTNLAKIFKHFSNKTQNFFYGFQSAINPTLSPQIYQYAEWQEGFYYGMSYKNAITNIEEIVSKYGITYKEALENAENEIGNLIENSSKLFHEQTQQILDTKRKTNAEIEEIKTNFKQFKETKEKQLDDLEKLYGEKLKLEKPAKYWEDMSNEYAHSGVKWLIISSVIAIITIVLLTLFIINIPTLFADTSDWLDIIKNTAILTVITGVAIYILRITVKLSMSSFHLSRDAKEREQLSYFYLALMESKGVTEQERILIISSLFSRSDTGLLKGDSAPTMPQNISDIINKMDKK